MKLVTVSQAQGHVPITVFQLHGRVNMGNTAELEQAAEEAYSAGARNFVIDLSQAPSLTSAAIRTFISIYKMLADDQLDKARHFKLVSPTQSVREVLDIAGLSDTIEIFDSLEKAVASF